MKEHGKHILTIIGIMYVVSFLLLGMLTLCVWKMDGGTLLLSGGIIGVYVITNLLGGFLTGKIMGQQKFFWGILVGCIYFFILLLAGVGFMGTKLSGNHEIITGIMICAISGMLGGMIAPGKKERKNA